MLTWGEIAHRAMEFSREWAGETYEKGEAQSFYNDFFDIFGVKRRKVARFEEHVRLLDNSSGFIDLFWPGVLIAEHKSRGADLQYAERRAGDYFDALDDDAQPQFQLVCDFQHFTLLDRDNRTRIEFELPDLHLNVRYFAFILGQRSSKPRIREHLDRRAAEIISDMHKELVDSRYPRGELETFLTRLVFCLFADNTGIFQPRGFFADLVEYRSSPDGSDLGQWLSLLFQILNQPLEKRQRTLDEDLAEFPYVDGGLFEELITIPCLSREFRCRLLSACKFDWSEVSPAIFGALFQSVMTAEERSNLGGYATSEENIMKVVDSLFLGQLRAEFDEALRLPMSKRTQKLETLRDRLPKMRFLDPACGCGNFLVVSYRELRRLELDILIELNSLGALHDEYSKTSVVDVDQFCGIEIRSYSARIARTAMWMTDHTANSELSFALGINFRRVPLQKQATIVVRDALELDWGQVFPHGEHAYILGNPPYKGSKMQSEAERQQIRNIAGLGGAGGTLDYSCGWIIKAADCARHGAHVGLVTVSSVVQGEQAGQLWPILLDRFSMEISFAHQPFQWYSDAPGPRSQVQVVILGFCSCAHVGHTRPLYQYETATARPTCIVCRQISPYLICGDGLLDSHIVARETPRPVNGLRRLRTGTKPIDGGYYILKEDEKSDLVSREPAAAQYIRPFVGTNEFLYGKARYILVLGDASRKDLGSLPLVKELIEKVAQYRKAQIVSKEGNRRLERPSALKDCPTLFHITAIPTKPFLVIPEVTSENRRYVPIGWLHPPSVPSNLVKYLEDATLDEFALLTSAMHMAWLRLVGGRLEGRVRYSIEVVYNTFPIPENRNRVALSKAALHVLGARAKAASDGYSLADMYELMTMPQSLRRAHEALDREIDRQYLGKVADNDEERIVNLLNRYQHRSA